MCRFKEKDAFVGYQKDTAAAVVFQASSHLRQMSQRVHGQWREGEEEREKMGEATRRQLWETAWEAGLLGMCSLLELADEEEGSEQWMQAVSSWCQVKLNSCRGIIVDQTNLGWVRSHSIPHQESTNR